MCHRFVCTSITSPTGISQTLVTTSPVGVVVFDARMGMPESANREARRLVEGLLDEGQRSDDLLDMGVCVRGDGREVSLRELPVSEALSAGETVRAEEPVKPKRRTGTPQPASMSMFEWAMRQERERETVGAGR